MSLRNEAVACAFSCGNEEDASGLNLLGHRWYDSFSGRFRNRDQAQDGRNWYSYAGNEPLDEVDPEGLRIRFVGYTAKQLRKARLQIHRIGRSKAGRQLIYGLVHDHIDHVISPENTPGDPNFSPKTKRLRYDPNERLTLYGKGKNGKNISAPPDVILIHELGHVYGKPDPGNGQDGSIPAPGDTVHDFENPYRKEHKLPQRMAY